NRLVKVMDGASTVATYAYDGQTRRTTKTSGGTTRHYYYTQEWQILEERVGASTSADRQFVWGLRYLDDLVERDRGSERFYAFHDYFNCTAIADTTGTVQERYGYDGFGASRVMDGSFNNRSASLYDWEIRYADYRWDNETGFYQVRHRYLHAKLGRWITTDPVEESILQNLYAYAENNSVSFVDPFGMQVEDEKNCWTYGEIRQWAIYSFRNLTTIPMGLADAKESIYASCSNQRKICKVKNPCACRKPGPKENKYNLAAWRNIMRATGGTDKSNSGNFMCVGSEKCWFVHSCCCCEVDQQGKKTPKLKKRDNPLKAVGTVIIITASGKHTLY